MFLHIGDSKIVFNSDIVGIFDLKLRQSPVNKQLLESVSSTRFLPASEYDNYKSFIITGETIHLSPISPTTLARRKSASRYSK